MGLCKIILRSGAVKGWNSSQDKENKNILLIGLALRRGRQTKNIP
jgi:hypothetical protein